MKLNRILWFILALLMAATPALAAVSVVSPTKDFYVNDSANVLSEAVEEHIILNNDALYEACGAQIVIVTVDKVASTTMENYAYTLFNEWGIGSAEKDNGFLLLMSIDDDDYWYLQGSGIQDSINSGDLGEIADQYLEPSFAAKDYSTGAKLFFDALFKEVVRVYGLTLSLDDSLSGNAVPQTATAAPNHVKNSFSTYRSYTSTSTTPTAAPSTARTVHYDEDEDDNFSALLGFLLIVAFFVIRHFIKNAPRSGYSGSSTYRSYSSGSGFGSSHSSGYRSSGYSSSRSSYSGSSHSSYSGSSHSSYSGSSRSSGSSSRSGGGGSSRGGGGGRHR